MNIYLYIDGVLLANEDNLSEGAELQNLLKLFEGLIDGQVSNLPSIPNHNENKELVIY